jgi:hypothetical protein
METPTTRAVEPPGMVLDGFLSSYVTWREEAERVRSAYERWSKAALHERELSFVAYRTALEHEEFAADLHSDWAAMLRECRDQAKS